MTKKERRKQENAAEAQLLRRQAEQAVQQAHWDRDAVKQYVRREGWLSVIRKYRIRRARSGVKSPLKFLTLPGESALDIGYFWKAHVLKQNEDGRLNVAICDKEQAAKVAANLGHLGGVLAYSTQLLHQELQQRESPLCRYFPFDVINLDSCSSLIARDTNTGIETLDWLFRLQRGQGFLLLLTTRPDPQAGSNQRLLEILRRNLDDEIGFRDAFSNRFGSLDGRACISDSTLFNQLVIPKLVARYARQSGYRTHEHFAACYKRIIPGDQQVDHYDMMCHSFELEPIYASKPNPALRYEPRFKKLARGHHEDLIYGELSTRVRNRANNAYSSFVSTLPGRQSVRVEDHIASNPELQSSLQAEADSLQQWWSQT